MTRGLGSVLSGLLVVACAAGSAHAATINVSREIDGMANDGFCTLREAVLSADTDVPSGPTPGECAAGSGTDTIALGAGLYTLAGELFVQSDMSIVGAGPLATILSAADDGRVIRVLLSSNLTLDAVTVTGGLAPSGFDQPAQSGTAGNSSTPDAGPASGPSGGAGAPGGGILNAGTGTLTVLRSRVVGNQAGSGGNGGGATGGNGFTDNGVVTCGNGGQGNGGAGGPGGDGGGIYSLGPLVVRDSAIIANIAGHGGAGGLGRGGSGGSGGSGFPPGCPGGRGNGGDGGNGGAGGGIAAVQGLLLERSVVSENSAGAGGGASDGQGGQGGNGASAGGAGGAGGRGDGGDGGLGGGGGGVAALGGAATVTATTLAGNDTGTGGGAGFGDAGAGGEGRGSSPGGAGAIAFGGLGGRGGFGGGAFFAVAAEVSSTLATGNGTGRGGSGGKALGGEGGNGAASGPGGNGVAGEGGSGGSGGGFFFGAGATAVNITVSGNTGLGGGVGGDAFGGGADGDATSGGGGAAGAGGVEVTGSGDLRALTITGNNAGNPGLAGTPHGTSLLASGTSGSVGVGALRAGGGVSLSASIISASTPATCAGSFADGGFNIVAPGHLNCPGATGDPLLGPLASNGGSTQTHALGAGSAALDVVNAGDPSCPATDQRGVSRPRAGGCDAGAYERAAPQAVTGAAVSLTPTTARLTGSVIANGRATTVRFEFGRTPNLGSTTGALNAGGALAAAGVGANIAGLEPGATYHYRVVASSADGASAGTVRTFTTPADRAAPVISRARISPRRFAVRRGSRGARVRFRLSENAAVILEVRRLLPGRLTGRRCAPPSRANRKGRRCKRRKLAGRIRAIGSQGANSVRFRGRIRGKALRRGSYELKLLATDAAGNRASPKRLTFKIVR